MTFLLHLNPRYEMPLKTNKQISIPVQLAIYTNACKIIKKYFVLSTSEGVHLAMSVCCTGPWHSMGSRYARALVDDNTVNQRYRWLLHLR